MAPVSLCRRCGYVNQWMLKSCPVGGEPAATRIQPGRSDPWNAHRDKASRSPRRLGKGRVFITPDNMVGIVRMRLVTSPGFLRRPVLRYSTDHLVTHGTPMLFQLSFSCMTHSE
jgi:hypothetical protein